MIGAPLALALLGLGFGISLLSGLIGIGGGIVLAPALLLLPPLLGLPELDMRAVSGLTITQALFACLAGAVRHDRYRFIDRRLALVMGGTIAVAALAGALASSRVSNDGMLMVLAVLAAVAAVLVLVPRTGPQPPSPAAGTPWSVPAAISLAVVVGGLGGLVGQGGSFLLIPLMLHVLKLPLRVAIGSNLAIVFMASLAGFLGKLATDQIPLVAAVFLVAGSVPGAWLGSTLSRRTSLAHLRGVLAIVIGAAAIKLGADALAVIGG